MESELYTCILAGCLLGQFPMTQTSEELKGLQSFKDLVKSDGKQAYVLSA